MNVLYGDFSAPGWLSVSWSAPEKTAEWWDAAANVAGVSVEAAGIHIIMTYLSLDHHIACFFYLNIG
ncbi:hypothetical protein [Parageobacillus thermoglucosidasius]|uniref:hypothetical protein n=1 Tax=Parageobacillus thermoglucosidasius TaxID=1426 RepID=UPI000AF584FE|nr:hypothetical protein [Parageobacillus thermoglucosidasius]